MRIKLGDTVKQKVHVIEGEVTSKEFDQVSDSFIYKVSYIGADGEKHETAFSEDAIELVPAESVSKTNSKE